jgi:hypothetical protein
MVYREEMKNRKLSRQKEIKKDRMEFTAAKGRKEDGDMNNNIYKIQLVVNH